MSKINLLKDWHEKMSELFWSSGYASKWYLNQKEFFNLETLRFIHDNIYHFFPEEAYTIKTGNGQLKLNWLQDFLYSVRDPRFIGYIREIAFIIDYFNNSNNLFEKLNIKPKNKNITRLRDRFFEVFVNMILDNNGIHSIPNVSYEVGNIEKPIDSFFEFNSKKYLIECAKLYDIKQTVLLKIVLKVIKRVFIVKGKMVNMYPHIQPSGYILFKDTKDILSIEHRLEQDFSQKFQEYLDNMNSRNEIAKPHSSLETDFYKIFIGSNLFYKFAEDDERFRYFDMYSYFRCNIKLGNVHSGKFIINAVQKRNTEQEYKIICSRIENKIKQHKQALDFQLIIFLEFEQSISVGDEERSLNVDFNYLNLKRFEKYISDKVSIFFLLKKFDNMRSYYEIRFLPSHGFDKNLENTLRHLKFPSSISVS